MQIWIQLSKIMRIHAKPNPQPSVYGNHFGTKVSLWEFCYADFYGILRYRYGKRLWAFDHHRYGTYVGKFLFLVLKCPIFKENLWMPWFRQYLGSGLDLDSVRSLDPDPDPGRQKMNHNKKVKSEENSCLEELDVLFEGLKVSPVA